MLTMSLFVYMGVFAGNVNGTIGDNLKWTLPMMAHLPLAELERWNTQMVTQGMRGEQTTTH